MRRSSRGSSIPGWGDDDESDLGTGLLQAEVMGPGGGAGPASGSGRSVQLISRFGGGHRYAGLDEEDDRENGANPASRGRSDSFTSRSRRLSGGGASAVVPVERSAAEVGRINEAALAKQKASNAKFMEQMKKEEDAFLARVKKKKATEDSDAALARRLQQEEEAAAAAAMGAGARRRQEPGSNGPRVSTGMTQLVRINLPSQVEVGSVLRINVPGVGLRDVIVPPGAVGGASVEYQVPISEKTIVRVTLPEGCTPGQVISVKVPGSSETVQVTVPANASPGSTLQFQVSSNRVPPPVQAVGHQSSLGAAAEIYGNTHGGAAPSSAPRRRSSTGVSWKCIAILCNRFTNVLQSLECYSLALLLKFPPHLSLALLVDFFFYPFTASTNL